MLILGIVLLFVGSFIFVSGLWEMACYVIAAMMVNPNSKPNQFQFSVNWKVQWLPFVFWLAGTLVIVLR